MKKITLMLMIIALVAPATFGASLSEGTKEMAVSGLLDFDTESDTRLDIDLFLGYFVMDNLEVGGEVGLRTDDDTDRVKVGVRGEYNFVDLGTEQLVPFARA